VSAPDPTKLAAFHKKLENKFGQLGSVGCTDLIDHRLISDDPLISELVFSILVWESSIEHAIKAVEAIDANLIDLNELRVCTPDELVALLPARYPKLLERSQRLIVCLNSVFERENKLSLVHLREMTKKDVLTYFESIKGVPAFVTARVILLGLGWHAFPIDEWLANELDRAGVVDKTSDIPGLISRMERAVRASDSLKFYTLIEHWATDQRAAKLNAKKSTVKGSS
jgi:thermostable 8-oxoguanine DNA glycosylase